MSRASQEVMPLDSRVEKKGRAPQMIQRMSMAQTRGPLPTTLSVQKAPASPLGMTPARRRDTDPSSNS